MAQLESEMSKLQQTANLFEVSFPEYKQLGQCRSDLILVKAVWDMVMFVKVIQTLLHLTICTRPHKSFPHQMLSGWCVLIGCWWE